MCGNSLNDIFTLQVTHGPEKVILAVLTDKDLLLYPSMPESKERLSSPNKSHPLITTRSTHTQRASPCFGRSNPLMLTLSITPLFNISAHKIIFIWKTLVQSEPMSHVFPPVYSTFYFSTSGFILSYKSVLSFTAVSFSPPFSSTHN